ncbi:MAG: hypothetical protein V3V45_03680 [Candidatus Brocadiales bacterium]
MPEYNYRAIDDHGKPKKGTLVADTEIHLEEILNGDGYYLLEASEIQAIVRSEIHKPEIVDSQEEEERGWQQGTKPPPGVRELHLHQHVYSEAKQKEKKELTFGQKLAGEKICPNCERIVRPIMRVGWFWVIVLSIITFPVFLIFYAIYYTFFKRKECPICAHRFFLLK